MEREEINAFLIYGGIGALCGVFAAVLSRHTKNPFAWTVLGTIVEVPVAVLVGVGILGAVESIKRFGFDPGRAILAGISTAFFLVFAVPWLCGIPALVAGLATQLLLQFAIPLRLQRTTQNVRMQLSLRTLFCMLAVAPPLLAVFYFQPMWGTMILVPLTATYVLVNVSLAIVEY